MSSRTSAVIPAMNRYFLEHHPDEAAVALGKMRAGEAARLLEGLPERTLPSIWRYLPAHVAENLLTLGSESFAARLLKALDPAQAAQLLGRLAQAQRDHYLGELDTVTGEMIRELLAYPQDSAGYLMDARIHPLHQHMSAKEALEFVRKHQPRFTRELFVVDAERHLSGMVDIQRLALAPPGGLIRELIKPVPAAVPLSANREQIIETLNKHKMTELPVHDYAQRLVGIIRYDQLVTAIQEERTADMLTMVGAGKDEHTLSPATFAVRKRIPWLQINLLTAFLAASVVGLFESTIAQFTALAVLLPVVAGQSGNSGAQALAVTMRGLALREIGIRQWRKVARKELTAGLMNGVIIALTTGIGVLIWSGSPGLALVIGVAMVISMMAAGFSGAIIPMILTALKQDPAQSSSIVLTTVTDVVGFFSFLGIATLLSALL